METVGARAFKLVQDLHAWNVDGSSADRLVHCSWIKHWEDETGLQRGVCSFEGCSHEAEHGGHVWIKNKGVYIAPVCKSCNYIKNIDRMQHGDGKHSSLRRGTVVVKTEYTEEMACSDRRIAINVRRCEQCDADISDRPPGHTRCLGCYRSPGRQCEQCAADISDRPPTHTRCLGCYRSPEKRVRYQRNRGCEDCDTDISDRPAYHTRCVSCYRM